MFYSILVLLLQVLNLKYIHLVLQLLLKLILVGIDFLIQFLLNYLLCNFQALLRFLVSPQMLPHLKPLLFLRLFSLI